MRKLTKFFMWVSLLAGLATVACFAWGNIGLDRLEIATDKLSLVHEKILSDPKKAEPLVKDWEVYWKDRYFPPHIINYLDGQLFFPVYKNMEELGKYLRRMDFDSQKEISFLHEAVMQIRLRNLEFLNQAQSRYGCLSGIFVSIVLLFAIAGIGCLIRSTKSIKTESQDGYKNFF